MHEAHFLLLLLLGASAVGSAADVPRQHKLPLVLRSRVKQDDGSFATHEAKAEWDTRKTAIIVCDMWAKHWCKGATRRVAEMAPHVNRFVSAARDKGVLIVHAPSGGMKHYANHPARQRAQSAPKAKNVPNGIAKGAGQLPSEKKLRWPIDQSDGGCDCGPKCKGPMRLSQIDAIKIHDADAISFSGVEIWNLFEQRGITNVMLLGVHTNMCVIGRPFGLRNMARFGKTVVLVRDLTDTMYNSRRWPHVSHFRGTELIVEHIEKAVCPTITSNQILSGEPFRFHNDRRPHIVFVIAEKLYKTHETLPRYARDVWEKTHGARTTVLHADAKDRNVVPGFAAAVAKADVVVLSARRRALPKKDLDALRKHLDAGKPLVAIRTSSHAFDTRGKHPKGHAEWQKFDAEVLGGNYHGHHGSKPKTTVKPAPGAKDHPILAGVKTPFDGSGSLYKTSPLSESAVPLLVGSIPGQKPEPVAWANTYKKARVFYTSLGHPDDFKDPQFIRLLTNAIAWAVQWPAPTGTAAKR